MNKKIIVILLISASVLLVGFGFWEKVPKLINADKPFVDLSGSIGDSIGNANSAYEASKITPVPTVTPVVTQAPKPTDTPDEDKREDNEVFITVGDNSWSGSGESIFVGEMAVDSIDALIKIISDKAYDGKTFIIMDNYAETECYRAVIKAIEDLGKAYKLDSVKDTDL